MAALRNTDQIMLFESVDNNIFDAWAETNYCNRRAVVSLLTLVTEKLLLLGVFADYYTESDLLLSIYHQK